jgi:hypothetical protein
MAPSTSIGVQDCERAHSEPHPAQANTGSERASLEMLRLVGRHEHS